MELRRGSRKTTYTFDDDDDDDDELMAPRRTRQNGGTALRVTTRAQDFNLDSTEDSSPDTEDDDEPRRSTRLGTRLSGTHQSRLTFEKHNNRPRLRTARFVRLEDSDENEEHSFSSGDDDYLLLQSDVVSRTSKRRRLSRKDKTDMDGFSYNRTHKVTSRRSERATRGHVNMEEVGEGEIFRSDSDEDAPALSKASGAREAFKALPRGNKFRERHSQICDSCGNSNNTTGTLVYCQGCTLSYHKACLGPRSGREHLVTKVGEDEFVLQCRRCINIPRKKDPTAPDLSKCSDCNELGASCAPFRKSKTSQQEQKEREENNGEDPTTNVDQSLVNNPKNVLFRCTQCTRAFHFHHLPSLNLSYMDLNQDEDERADTRFSEYAKKARCKECIDAPAKVAGLIAWRPDDADNYIRGQDVSIISEDHKEYLIKWESLSYFRAQWMPGAWTWGVIASAMRRAFFNKTHHPKMRTEDAIPEDWLRIDIVLDVKYTNRVDVHGYEIDKARVKEVGQALLKYKGLGYEDAVWEDVPSPDDGDRWTDFVVAYEDWVLGRYTTIPSVSHLKTRMEKVRSHPFKEKAKQPENLIGGELMKYQVDGMNWLYYQWYQQKSGILADEMGLGKTIQIIAFLATMVHDIKCFPFLIVVPNSTCANWRREIKQWAPQLRVVTYFGSQTARKLAYDYELFPDKSKTLRCHAVITSYDAAVDQESKRFFRRVQWQGLIVDEGQRLKNDQSMLHTALNSLRIPFRILLTGTPLQNNARELFNLLQFLDDTIDASKMEEEFAEMTNEKITELHSLIRPFILRRTKLQVLTFLPAMAQIILPVSMSVLQKKTYKGILAQRPELLRSLFSTTGLKSNERVGLNNILMQLRKCLCHPFVFNQSIEERELDHQVTHKNLVEASSKLQLLELLLPKLQERGHRVLIFSQFLDMLNVVEDFLEGMSLPYQRLDGQINSLEKQKRIDEFNAPSSPLFAFLLSTRAGGVGINLATADTVIILDPDFNPHQDIQAISRAHRIGQTKKVLCFQLMTRNSAEEKIMQIGRKKMALDEVVINQLDEEDVEERDMESILKYGMEELFNDDNSDQDIHYDDTSIEKLLDRSQIENTKSKDNTAESQFGFARIWANDEAALQESLNVSEEELQAPDPSFWEKILKEREAKAAARAAKEDLGRGKRQRHTVTYNANERDRITEFLSDGDDGGASEAALTPIPAGKLSRKRKRQTNDSDSDTDFQASDNEEATEDEGIESVMPNELDVARGPSTPTGAILGSSKKSKAHSKSRALY
jgi:chromodomain-helicase-DNA-binding protein 4